MSRPRRHAAGKSGIDRLLAVVRRLRGKHGCPWDRQQTLRSLKPYVIEEAYELLDAIDSNDRDRHQDELGDVLLQVVLQAQLRREKGDFSFDDVAGRLADKLIRRHPHVFGNVKVSGAGDVLRNWEAIKADEKTSGDRSILEGIPRHLPALQKAQRVQSRASRVGFDWSDVKDVLAKIDEELAETRRAIARGNRSEERRVGKECTG
jgi:MazG family protein